MSRYLLDTSVAILAGSQPERLSDDVRSALISGENHISVVSYWEVVLKSMKGKLDVGDPRSWWSNLLEQLSARVVVLSAHEVSAVIALPPIHQDPFDRILIATAIKNHLTFLTTDREIARYSSEDLAVLS